MAIVEDLKTAAAPLTHPARVAPRAADRGTAAGALLHRAQDRRRPAGGYRADVLRPHAGLSLLGAVTTLAMAARRPSATAGPEPVKATVAP